jgi:hypothetical protein
VPAASAAAAAYAAARIAAPAAPSSASADQRSGEVPENAVAVWADTNVVGSWPRNYAGLPRAAPGASAGLRTWRNVVSALRDGEHRRT